MNPSASSPEASAQAPAKASAKASAKRGARASASQRASSSVARGTPSSKSASAPASPGLGEVLDADSQSVVIAIPAASEFVRVVRLAVAGVATRMRFSYEQVEDIKLAVSEACNNAILHAHPPGGGAPTQVVVRLRPSDDRLEITVFDQGHLPPGGLDLPGASASGRASSKGSWSGLGDLDDLPEGGMGLILIQSLMDEVSSYSGAPDHTALHMVKRTRNL